MVLQLICWLSNRKEAAPAAVFTTTPRPINTWPMLTETEAHLLAEIKYTEVNRAMAKFTAGGKKKEWHFILPLLQLPMQREKVEGIFLYY